LLSWVFNVGIHGPPGKENDPERRSTVDLIESEQVGDRGQLFKLKKERR